MKKSKLIANALVTASIAVGASAVYMKKQAEKLENMKLSLGGDFTVTAHTGCMDTDENTINSMRVGAENADIIEFDVLTDENGTPRLAHTTITSESPTLAQAFEFIKEKENIKANVDIKVAENLSEVQRLAKESGVIDRIFFTGIREDDVPAVRKDSPEISYFLNVSVNKRKNRNEKYILSLVEMVKSLGAVGINMHYKGVSKKLVDAFHENRLLVSLWTVNSEKEIIRMLALSPDNITSRRPDLVHKIIGEHK